MNVDTPNAICHISTFSPTQCGIATFCEDLIEHIPIYNNIKVPLVYFDDNSSPKPGMAIEIQNSTHYSRAAQYINATSADVVLLQHEFGIFGGDYGEYVLELSRQLSKPLVVVFHTTVANNYKKATILRELGKRCARAVALTAVGGNALVTEFGIDQRNIDVIPHGIHDVPFVLPINSRERHRFESEIVFVSAGHVREAKGYHFAVEALALFREQQPDFTYLILGSPQKQFSGGYEYVRQLKHQIRKFKLESNVKFVEQYLPLQELLNYIISADVGLVTYTEPHHNSSGILPIIIGCGRPVIATNFEYARTVGEAVGSVILAKLNDANSICEKMIELTSDRVSLSRAMQVSYSVSRKWLWKDVGLRFVETCGKAKMDFDKI